MITRHKTCNMMVGISCALLPFIALTNATVHANDSAIDGLVQWVCSEGGFFNDKLEMRRVDPDDPTSYFGVFAKEDIDPEERLMQIPHSCYIQVFDSSKEMQTETEEDSVSAYHENICALSKRLMEEMKHGEDSQFSPYIAYLKTQKVGQLPVNWSKAGKDLLRKLFVPGSDGVDWIDRYYNGSCINDDNPFEIHMIEMTIQRCFDTALIPIWDMVNHDNGRLNTEHSSLYDEGGLKVNASGAIKAGEEILSTYDLCTDCHDISSYWGTPEILRDFGFVERYPTRWVFNDEEIWFEIHEDPETKYKDVEFHVTDEYDGTPSRKGIRFLQDEVERLNLVGEELESYKGTMPMNEFNIASLYYKTAVHDLSTAIENALWDLNIKETDKEL